MLKYHIQTVELSASTSTITINNIPQIYDDLYLVTSLRSDGGGTGYFARLAMTFNNSTSNRSSRVLYGFNSGTIGSESSSTISWFYTVSNSATANTFGNNSIYISNYTTTQNKSLSIDSVTESNDTNNIGAIAAGLWSDTSAINSIQIFFNEAGSNFVANSSVSLYGIKRGSDGKTEVAAGGTITTSGGYTIHTFNSSGTFVANRDLDVEYLVVAGGGGGGAQHGGGGGAGGYRCSVTGESSGGGASAEQRLRVLTGTSYNVIVGAGGSGALATATNGGGTIGTMGSNSSFSNITSVGGGGGAAWQTKLATTGGSGGGGNAGGATAPSPTGAGGTSGQGYAGGNGADNYSAAGGGGAGAVGGNGVSSILAGAGGAGVSSAITGSSVTRAGGGGGGIYIPSGTASGGAGGTGGGGTGGWADGGGTQRAAPTNGTTNTGSGGGGNGTFNTNAGSGGSGVVIIRYLTPAS
jgi:hypothetical protein